MTAQRVSVKHTSFFRMQIVYHVPTQRIGEVITDPFNPYVEREWLPIQVQKRHSKPLHEDWRTIDCEALGYDWQDAWKRYNRLLEAKEVVQK